MISRTGYSGERGYEIFCRAQDAGLIWDRILSEGAKMGIVPAAFTTLDMLRVESCLLFYPFDNSEMFPFEDEGPGDTLWELGLDFTVSPGKTGFRGADAHYRAKGRERFKIFGLMLEGEAPAAPGDVVYADGRKVGVASMALARLDPAFAVAGRAVEVRGPAGVTPAVTHTLPFDDPAKTKRTAVG
jgi:aminomethyltransferase